MLRFILLLLVLQVTAFAQSLRPGVYDGRSRDHKMFLRELPGREGSFLALIIRNGRQAVPYLVDEFATGRYGFVPLYNQKNLIGATNYTPSLTATVIADPRNNLQINISPNPGNNVGFNVAEVFKSTKETSPWLPVMPGNYSYKDNRRSTTLSPNDGSRESQLSVASGPMAGTYVLREVRPGMHLAFKSTLTTTGIEVVEESQHIVVFLRGAWARSDKMIFISTNNWSMTEFSLN